MADIHSAQGDPAPSPAALLQHQIRSKKQRAVKTISAII